MPIDPGPSAPPTPFLGPIIIPFLPDSALFSSGIDIKDASQESVHYSPLLTGGLYTPIAPSPKVQTPQSALDKYASDPTVINLRAAADSTVSDVGGRITVPSKFGFMNLGSGHNLDFDTDTLAGRITPAFANPLGTVIESNGRSFYTGSDIRLMIEVANPPKLGDARPRYAKQLFECTTISISIHRAKTQVRAFGYVNPKGFVRGTRTVAGTMVLTQFTTEVLFTFIQAALITNDKSKDSTYIKIDQLPPFNITMIFCNEQGFASYRRLLGVEFVTDGTNYSIQDMFTEQVISFMCMDFTPLLPLDLDSLYRAPISNKATSNEATPLDKIPKYNKINTTTLLPGI